jgi:hypothetical protein
MKPLVTAAPRGAGDLARRAGTNAGAWALKRPDTPKVRQRMHRGIAPGGGRNAVSSAPSGLLIVCPPFPWLTPWASL